MKKCNKCLKTYPLTDLYFPKNRKSSDGFFSRCKSCARESNKNNYWKNK